jgi:hypothetical protein
VDRGKRWRKGVGGCVYCKYCIYMYINEKVIPFETMSEKGEGA